MAKIKTSPEAAPVKPHFEFIPINKIDADENQPRKHFDETAMEELILSVTENGVLQPILVRPDGGVVTGKRSLDPRYKIVYGERRYRAAEAAGLAEIPAIVRELTDEQALEIQVIENLQRVNINPMEESDAFHRLLTKNITSAEHVADKLGVSVKYVYDRMALQKCIEPVKEAILEGKLTIGIGKQFARLPQGDQEKLWQEADLEEMSSSELKEQINRSFSLNLSEAVFSTTDAKLVAKAGSCEKCQKRSGCNLLLFDDIREEDICFDQACYASKQQAYLNALVKKLEKEGKKVVRLSADYGDRSIPDGVLDPRMWDKSDEAHAHATGVVVSANRYSSDKIGDTFFVTIDGMDPVEVDDETEESDDVDDVDDVEGGGQTVEPKKKWVDHDEAVSLVLFKKVLEKFKEGVSMPTDEYDLERKIRYQLSDLEETFLRPLCEVLGCELMVDDDGDFDFDKTFDGIIASSSDLMQLYCLAKLLIVSISVSWDADELKEAQERLALIGIDAFAAMQEYSASTNSAFEVPSLEEVK